MTALSAARANALWGTGLMLALLPATVFLAMTDPRLIAGAGIWAKPLKFQLSLAIHLATLAALLPLAGASVSGWLRHAVAAATAAAAFEVCYITLQAARGRASHFNSDTGLESALYNLMGVGAVILVGASFMLGIAIWRASSPSHGEGLRLGAALGLILGSVATLAVAGALSSGLLAGPGHLVAASGTILPDDSQGLPLLGWSTSAGDLRVPHFFATHIMQALPIAGLLADRLAPRRAKAAVAAAVAASLLLVAGTLAGALAGLPLIPAH